MPNPMIRIHNAETDEVIDREMTAEEFAQYKAEAEKEKAKSDSIAKAESDKASAQAKLEALGLTLDDLKALGL
jgi:hypothetical protein